MSLVVGSLMFDKDASIASSTSRFASTTILNLVVDLSFYSLQHHQSSTLLASLSSSYGSLSTVAKDSQSDSFFSLF